METWPSEVFRELLKGGLENACAHDAAVSHRARAWWQPGNGSAVRPPYNGQFSGSFGLWGEVMRLTPFSGYKLTVRAAFPGRNRVSPKDAMDPKVGVPILQAPSASARIVSDAATNVIVEAPQQPTAGFLRVVRPTGEKGWIEAGYLRPWHDPYTPMAKCYPAMMSDGKPGFGFIK